MADPQSECDPLEALAAEFMERLRAGEHPSVAEFTDRYPELAEEIRELFPTIASMEQLKARSQPAATGGLPQQITTPARLGDFRIVREIGRGGMGVVYEAQQESLGRSVAVKVLPWGGLADSKQAARFRRDMSFQSNPNREF